MSRNPNRMQEATDLLMGKMKSGASILIQYQDGAFVIPGIEATVGRTPFNVMNGEVMTAYESRDYLIEKADLTYGGVQLIPKSGALITETNGDVYEVSIPRGLNIYESIGPNGSVLKIHTKAVA
jgi:hypothetical protein